MIVTEGAANVSVPFYFVDDVSGTNPGEPTTGLLFSDIETGGSASFQRQGEARVDFTLVTLANASAAHTDGGFILIDDTEMPGVCRCDIPDAAVAAGADFVLVYLRAASGKNTITRPLKIDLDDLPKRLDRNADLTESQRGFHTWHGNYYYVDPTNGDTHANGNRGGRADPYLTLQDCHDNAITDSNHDVIFMVAGAAGGTTTHSIAATTTISKRYVFIRGPGRDFIFTRTGSGNTLAITADGIELSGMQIGTAGTGSGHGIAVTDADFHRIHNCWFLDTRGDGINLLRSSNTQIHDNHFDGTGVGGSGQGVHIVGTAGSSNDNVIHDNHFADTAGDAILIEQGTTNDTAIHHNVIHNATGWGINIGASSTNAQVHHNTLGNNSSGNIQDNGTTSVIQNNEDNEDIKAETALILADTTTDIPALIAALNDLDSDQVGQLVHPDTYFVSKGGDDGNSGLSPATATLTIGQAVTLASAGDTIRIGPGTYDEAVDSSALGGLHFIGSGQERTIISNTATPLTVTSATTIEDLSCTGSTTYGIGTSGGDNITIRRCFISGSGDGLYAKSSNNLLVEFCWITSPLDAAQVSQCQGLIMRYCTISTPGLESFGSTALLAEGSDGVIESCVIQAVKTSGNDNDMIAVGAGDHNGASRRNTLHLLNCTIICTTDRTGSATDIYGIKFVGHANWSGVCKVTGGSIFTLHGGDGTAYDLAQSIAGVLQVSNLLYDTDKTSGTITDLTNAILVDTGTDGVVLAATEDVYHADIDLSIDEANTQDEYTVTWFKNAARITSGITVPKIQVVKRADGTDLVALVAMDEVGSTGSYKKDEGTNRITAGEAVLVIVTATIDSGSRSFARVMSRDSSA